MSQEVRSCSFAEERTTQERRMLVHETNVRALITVVVLTALFVSSEAFELSMVARSTSTGTSNTLRRNNIPLPTPPIPSPFSAPGKAFDVTSGLVSQLAVMAIKHRLADHEDVTCDVSSKPSDLLLWGRVGPVSVKGQGWRSGRGLTCRAIEANVDTCELDVGRIMSDRKLILTKPAKGKALIAFNEEDFGNFLAHPRMALPGGLAFAKDNVVIDPVKGIITFGLTSANAKWRCTLRRGVSHRRRAVVQAVPVDISGEKTETLDWNAASDKLSKFLSGFFNDMVFELDGSYLSFNDIKATSKAQSPIVMLALNIVVKKFPSRGVDF